MNNEQTEQARIAEINQHIRDGINQWADIMLLADADAVIKELKQRKKEGGGL